MRYQKNKNLAPEEQSWLIKWIEEKEEFVINRNIILLKIVDIVEQDAFNYVASDELKECLNNPDILSVCRRLYVINIPTDYLTRVFDKKLIGNFAHVRFGVSIPQVIFRDCDTTDKMILKYLERVPEDRVTVLKDQLYEYLINAKQFFDIVSEIRHTATWTELEEKYPKYFELVYKHFKEEIVNKENCINNLKELEKKLS